MKVLKTSDPYKIILFAPLIFLIHVVEEFPNFVNWVNSLIINKITEGMFLSVNLFGLVITILLSALLAMSKDDVVLILALAWLSFLMFANGSFHLVATIMHGYSPGVITAVFLYLPYFVWFVWLVIKTRKLKPTIIGVTVFIGSLPMFLHGYMIVFEGRTLF